MATLTHSFSSVGQSPVFLIGRGEGISYSLSGTFSATVSLEKSTYSGGWVAVATSTSGSLSASIYGAFEETRYRWNCTSYTSGTATCSISDIVETIGEPVVNSRGQTVLEVTDDGIETSKLTVEHSATSESSEIASTVINSVTATLGANQSNTAFASLSILQPTGTAGNPSYFVGSGGEIQVPAASTNYLQNATLYGGKFIVNYDTSATSGTTVAYLIGLESELILKGTNVSGTVTYANVYNLLVANEPFTQTGGGNVSITEYRGIYVEALSLGARFTITNQWNLYVEDTLGGNYFGAPIMVIGAAAPAVGGVTHRGVGGIRTESANTQDAMRVVGRAGGTSSHTQTLTTATLTGSRTVTFPDASMTFGATSAGGSVTQTTSRTTSVTLNAICGDITLVSAAGSSSWNSFTVNNSTVAVNDKIIVNVKTGTDIYLAFVTLISAGSFRVTFSDLTGTTVEQPVITFQVIKFTAQ